MRWVFLGSNGIRAGWGILLFATVWLGLAQGAGWVLAPLLHFDPSRPIALPTGIVVELAQFLPVVIATGLLAFMERRTLLSYGFRGNARALRLVCGLLWGFVAISALTLLLWKLGYLALTRGSLSAGAALEHAAGWGLAFLIAGFFEESLFRGYVQFTITRGIGFWWGTVLFSLIFAFEHTMNPGESLVGLASVVAAGVIFSLSLWYTGSLWWAVGFHAAWDWGQSYFYGTPDSGMQAQSHLLNSHPAGPVLWSGGATGPEGSLLVLPTVLTIAVLMVLWWGRRVQSPFAGMAFRPPRRRPEVQPAIPADV